MLGSDCQGFTFHEAKKECEWGAVVPVAPYNNFVPTYLMDGVKISFKKSLLVKNSLKDVTHFGYLDDDVADAVTDAALERPDLLPVPIPLPPFESSYFAVESYRNGVLCCGGKITAATGDKKCR